MSVNDVGYRKLFDDNNVPMFVRGRETLSILEANRAACEFYGYTREEFLALGPIDLYPETPHTEMWTYYDTIQNDDRIILETTHELSNGERVSVEVWLSRITWEGTPSNLVVVKDISKRTVALAQLEEQAEILSESESRYRHLFEANLTPMLVLDHAKMLFIDVNQAACDYYGNAREAFLQLGPLDWYPPSKPNSLGPMVEKQIERGRASFDTIHLKQDGTSTDVHVSIVPIPWNGISARLVMIQDLSERTEALSKALTANESLQRAQKIASFGDWVVDLRTGERVWSDELFRILGISKRDGIPKTVPPYAGLFGAEDILQMRKMEKTAIQTRSAQGSDHQIKRPDGTTRWVHRQVLAEFDDRGVPIRMLGTLHDITDRKDTETRLAAQARIDALTGLPNRKATSEAVAASISSAKRNRREAALFFIDIDHFKIVNDTLGHTAGDTLLKELAIRLRSALRAEDFLGRMGGDEFVVVLADALNPERIAAIADNIQQALTKPLHLQQEVVVSVSIGIARYPQDGLDVESLIMNADTAMYHAKHAGRSTYAFFSPDMHAAAESQLKLGNEMRKSIDAEDFVVFYQPIVSPNGTIVAAEALVRWPQSDGSLVAPADFIPHAEESGMILKLGRWIMRTACSYGARWNRCADTPLRINVNVSARELASPGFIGSVFDALAASGLRPELLEIEITETAISGSPETGNAIVGELRRAGIRVALDDFGTGYNSLLTLRTLQVDTLKIDKCFVDSIEYNAIDQAIVTAIIAAARSLGASAVAEGVETSAQGAFLQLLNIDEMQGYYFGKPMCADAFERFLFGHHRNEAA